jgi:hypothetical protein
LPPKPKLGKKPTVLIADDDEDEVEEEPMDTVTRDRHDPLNGICDILTDIFVSSFNTYPNAVSPHILL